jgi:hypothetical protein
VGKRHDDAVTPAHEREEVPLGLGEAAGRHGRPLGLERVALAGGELRHAQRVAELDARPELLAHDVLDFVRLPDEVRRRERRNEIGRDRRRLALLVVDEHRLEIAGEALGRRVDGRLVELVERPLREGRERAQRLDLVAEELDAHGLSAGRGEDVDDAAAHGELPALLGLGDPLVAGESEVLGEALDTGLVPAAQDDRLRARALRRDPLGRAERGGADEPTGGEHLERAGPLADEVRRRLEPAPPADAARGEEPDALLAEEP